MTNFVGHFTLHLLWRPVKFQILQQKIGEKKKHIAFWCLFVTEFLKQTVGAFFSINSRQLGHLSHIDSLSEQDFCQGAEEELHPELG